MKITKRYVQHIIKEELIKELSSGPHTTGHGIHNMPNVDIKMANHPDGIRPDQSSQQRYQGRPPYETLGVESEVDETGRNAEIYVGHAKYKITLNEDKTSGVVVPEGKYTFNVVGSNINWNGDVPYHVSNNSRINEELRRILEIK